MVSSPAHDIYINLRARLQGEVKLDKTTLQAYATDASIYRKRPSAVVYPQHEHDIVELVKWGQQNHMSITPRSGGTSLAGQCVTDGVVVDVSRYMDGILSINEEQRTVVVQPGVVLEELNRALEPHGLMFGPNTSTSNRCTIGGMVGNNSCGTTSIRYGSTRDKLLNARVVLGSGEVIDLGPRDHTQLRSLLSRADTEGKIYRQLRNLLQAPEIQQEILDVYPKPSVSRRNGGYALDRLLEHSLVNESADHSNLATLFCGSEGTLGICTELTLQLDPVPPVHSAMMLAHFATLDEAMVAVPLIMKGRPYLLELMDDVILDCTRDHPTYKNDLDLINGSPKAVLMIQYNHDNPEALDQWMAHLKDALALKQLGYHYGVYTGDDIGRAIHLRKAGLGLLALLPGDRKAVACIEDTAVDIHDLQAYIKEFSDLMHRHQQEAVYYAHAGAGELHLRPKLDLKKSEDRTLLRTITEETAALVKKYRGSVSGEHGDGIVRSESLHTLYGPRIMDIHKAIKKLWDPAGILNPGKIVDPWKMDEDLRYEADQVTKSFDTVLDFSDSHGILRMAEQCNGSGDCRKGPLAKGGMCPSYHASKNELHTTRARANVLREQMTNAAQPFESDEVAEVLEHCISCKLCKSECPSKVDMARLKAESLYQRFTKDQSNTLRNNYLLSDKQIHRTHILGSIIPRIVRTSWASNLLRKRLNLPSQRSLPHLSTRSLKHWWRTTGRKQNPLIPKAQILFFNDEFTNHLDAHIGQKMITVLQKIGMEIECYTPKNSGRAAISLGDLKRAKKRIEQNVRGIPTDRGLFITGLEPSALLGLKDEYPLIVRENLIDKSKQLAQKTRIFAEIVLHAVESGWVNEDTFTQQERKLIVHVHCHQKALSDAKAVAKVLSLPAQHQVKLLDTGCCGMAGSYGYSAKNYEMSQAIAESNLYPSIRNADGWDVVATGTSCRHQILDGLNKTAYHTAEILYDALRR